jgi:hypothetical protein
MDLSLSMLCQQKKNHKERNLIIKQALEKGREAERGSQKIHG